MDSTTYGGNGEDRPARVGHGRRESDAWRLTPKRVLAVAGTVIIGPTLLWVLIDWSRVSLLGEPARVSASAVQRQLDEHKATAEPLMREFSTGVVPQLAALRPEVEGLRRDVESLRLEIREARTEARAGETATRARVDELLSAVIRLERGLRQADERAAR